MYEFDHLMLNQTTYAMYVIMQVTSPGGTTASAMYALESGGFRTVISNGIWSAYRKSLELGGNDSNVGPGRWKR